MDADGGGGHVSPRHQATFERVAASSLHLCSVVRDLRRATLDLLSSAAEVHFHQPQWIEGYNT